MNGKEEDNDRTAKEDELKSQRVIKGKQRERCEDELYERRSSG